MATSNTNDVGISYPRTKMRSKRQVTLDIEALLQNLRKQSSRGLHVGCGASKIPNLVNCDLFNPAADLKADASNLHMFEAGSVDLIESHHMIEHLSFEDTSAALAEWRRVLRANGIVVLTFPDLTAVCRKWLLHSLANTISPRPETLDYIVQMLVGSQEHDGMFHKNGFDLKRMTRVLKEFGFVVEFSYCRYPMRSTPSRLVVARKAEL